MHLLLSDATGRRAEGILLAASPGCMRIVLRMRNDTTELRQIGGRWFSDGGEPIEIEAWIADEPCGSASFYAQFTPRVHTAQN